MKLIKQGAEAHLYKTKYLQKECLLKKRIPKTYRHPQLDEKISKARTKQEALLLHKAKKNGIKTPYIYEVNLKKKEIHMEWIKGKTLKQALLKGKKRNTLQTIGQKIGSLHTNAIVHGDLTTSNIIINTKNEPIFIDFGLGYNTTKHEDQAVDLLNFHKTITTTHTKTKQEWETIIKGYRQTFSKSKEVLAQMEKIEKRTRYA
jgi:Kae1-associated kinase Bud32